MSIYNFFGRARLSHPRNSFFGKLSEYANNVLFVVNLYKSLLFLKNSCLSVELSAFVSREVCKGCVAKSVVETKAVEDKLFILCEHLVLRELFTVRRVVESRLF